MKWQDLPISVTTAKRSAITCVIREFGDITLRELSQKTMFELRRVNGLGEASWRSLRQTIEDAQAGKDVRHPMHKPIGEAA